MMLLLLLFIGLVLYILINHNNFVNRKLIIGIASAAIALVISYNLYLLWLWGSLPILLMYSNSMVGYLLKLLLVLLIVVFATMSVFWLINKLNKPYRPKKQRSKRDVKGLDH